LVVAVSGRATSADRRCQLRHLDSTFVRTSSSRADAGCGAIVGCAGGSGTIAASFRSRLFEANPKAENVIASLRVTEVERFGNIGAGLHLEDEAVARSRTVWVARGTLPIRELEPTDLAPSPLELIDVSDETHASYLDCPVIATHDLDRIFVVLACGLQDEDGFVSPR
jgi:hypothetical protein